MSINENEGLAEGLKDFYGFKNAYIKGHIIHHRNLFGIESDHPFDSI